MLIRRKKLKTSTESPINTEFKNENHNNINQIGSSEVQSPSKKVYPDKRSEYLDYVIQEQLRGKVNPAEILTLLLQKYLNENSATNNKMFSSPYLSLAGAMLNKEPRDAMSCVKNATTPIGKSDDFNALISAYISIFGLYADALGEKCADFTVTDYYHDLITRRVYDLLSQVNSGDKYKLVSACKDLSQWKDNLTEELSKKIINSLMYQFNQYKDQQSKYGELDIIQNAIVSAILPWKALFPPDFVSLLVQFNLEKLHRCKGKAEHSRLDYQVHEDEGLDLHLDYPYSVKSADALRALMKLHKVVSEQVQKTIDEGIQLYRATPVHHPDMADVIRSMEDMSHERFNEQVFGARNLLQFRKEEAVREIDHLCEI